MEIRALVKEELELAMKLKVKCWDEELAGVAPNRLIIEKEIEFMVDWIQSAEQNNDIRIVLGAFEGQTLMGFIGASIAEEKGITHAIELNYLFVDRDYRGKGLSLKLMREVFEVFIKQPYNHLIVYNHHYAPSNSFYKKLGGIVIRQEIQGVDQLLIDLFLFTLNDLNLKLNQIIQTRYNFN